ncbi:hypothetical protein [Bowmanella pacifica]|uniref:Uncharacterized protein n=1 Tax=Bowmanella pacifica TaxID=502051 RepID=A0A918DKU7_9ALTE|nr:hypothetical protein [Bowmanella pacifica]GGO69645.1 hypothetical protein GCM10010982_21300 [Bowmanella pacifica]
MSKQNHLGLIVSGGLLAGILLITYLVNRTESLSQQSGPCQLQQGDCEFNVAGQPGSIGLSPKPIPIEEPLAVSLHLPKGSALISAHIEGVNMYMGRIPVIAEQQNGQIITAVSYLGSCSEPNMQWRLVLVLQDATGKSLTRNWEFYTHL